MAGEITVRIRRLMALRRRGHSGVQIGYKQSEVVRAHTPSRPSLAQRTRADGPLSQVCRESVAAARAWRAAR